MESPLFANILASKRNGTLYIGVTNLEARAREHSLKRWRRAWKIALIEKLNPDWRDLTNEIEFLTSPGRLLVPRMLRSAAVAAWCTADAGAHAHDEVWVPALRCIVKDAAPRPGHDLIHAR